MQAVVRYGVDEMFNSEKPLVRCRTDNVFAQGMSRPASFGSRQPVVRPGHEAFLDRASDAIASSVAESTKLLREVGSLSRGASQRHLRSQGGFAAGRSLTPPPARSITPPPPALSTVTVPEQPLAVRSARELFAALSGGPAEVALPSVALPSATPAASGPCGQTCGGPRVISVHDFQRGAPLVAPAAPLPFPGPGGESPGRRRRAKALAASEQPQAVGAVPPWSRATAAPADGVTAMLTGACCDLGEILTAPTAPCSSFDSLLDRLVDSPEACFADPLALCRGQGGNLDLATGLEEWRGLGGQACSFDA